jgi:hypothetical protein
MAHRPKPALEHDSVIDAELILLRSEAQSRCGQFCANARAVIDENSAIIRLSQQVKDMVRLLSLLNTSSNSGV